MAKGRLLLKSISHSRKVNALKSDTARLLYTWLIAHLDRQGCFYGDPDDIKSYVFPKRKDLTEVKIDSLLNELMANHLVVRYDVSGKKYLYMPDFIEKQDSNFRPDREGDSGIPLPAEIKNIILSSINLTSINLTSIMPDTSGVIRIKSGVATPKSDKKPYSDKVFLTDEEYQKLLKLYGRVVLAELIEDLDLYVGKRKGGDPYIDHCRAIQSFAKRAGIKKITPTIKKDTPSTPPPEILTPEQEKAQKEFMIAEMKKAGLPIHKIGNINKVEASK